jgi:predicted dehydrogenase
MERVRIGVIGAGCIAQVEHVPNLLRLAPKFAIIGVCDPSRVAREFIGARYGIASFERPEDLLSQPLDAILIASPDALHKEQALAGLRQGLHVFCEKPLCYAAADIDELIAARDAAGKVLQVGYMKRFDPSYQAALSLLPGTPAALRQISVEVSDPDAMPFTRHHFWRSGDDVLPVLIAEAREKQRIQVARAVGLPLDELGFRGFCGAYCSSLVHDVNAVHGLLDRLGINETEVAGAQIYAGGAGGHGAVRLAGGQALWTMTHLSVPKIADYRERITLYFEDSSLELEFPSPYLNHQPTRLTLRKGKGDHLSREDIHSGYEEAFVAELEGFWSAITAQAPIRNTAEQARRDMALLAGLARWQATHPPQPLARNDSA